MCTRVRCAQVKKNKKEVCKDWRTLANQKIKPFRVRRNPVFFCYHWEYSVDLTVDGGVNHTSFPFGPGRGTTLTPPVLTPSPSWIPVRALPLPNTKARWRRVSRSLGRAPGAKLRQPKAEGAPRLCDAK